jgi:hypothetical protein
MKTAPRRPRGSRGFRAAVLFIGFVFGVLFLGLVQNIAQIRERLRQTRSMSDIRAAGVALEAFAQDHGGLFPLASEGDPGEPLLEPSRFEWGQPCAWPLRASAGLDEIAFLLEPRYISSLPRRDAWGNPLLYGTSQDLRSYAIVSRGRNGLVERCQCFTWREDGDLVYSDGSFRSFTEGFCG